MKKGGKICCLKEDECEIKKELGRGAYGSVLQCGKYIARKSFTGKVDFIPENIKSLNTEFGKVPDFYYYTTFYNDKEPCPDNCEPYNYILKLCNGGDLTNLNYENLDLNLLSSNIIKMLHGLDFFTSKNYIHSDIKMQNILINDGEWFLHDFDLCTKIKVKDPLYYSFTPYYISPFLLYYGKFFNQKEKQTNISSENFITIYLLSQKLYSGGKITNELQNIIDYIFKSCDDNEESFYSKVIKNIYGDELSFDFIFKEISRRPDLKLQNMLKNDYYAFGLILFSIVIKIKNKNKKYTEYCTNFLEPIIFYCIVPFYNVNDVPDGFKHGAHILKELTKWKIIEYSDEFSSRYESRYEDSQDPSYVPYYDPLYVRSDASMRLSTSLLIEKTRISKIESMIEELSTLLEIEPALQIQILGNTCKSPSSFPTFSPMSSRRSSHNSSPPRSLIHNNWFNSHDPPDRLTNFSQNSSPNPSPKNR